MFPLYASSKNQNLSNDEADFLLCLLTVKVVHYMYIGTCAHQNYLILVANSVLVNKLCISNKLISILVKFLVIRNMEIKFLKYRNPRLS